MMLWGVERVTLPVEADAVIWLAVPVMEVTPLLVIVTAPVAPDTEMPVPATALVTPVLLMVRVPEPVVVLIPVPVPRDATEKLVPLPISSWPFVGVAVAPVPPAAGGSVPAVSADALVEYRALLAPENVVRPVPP